MNTYNKSIITEFRSNENTSMIKKYIINHFNNNHLVRNYLNNNFNSVLNNACDRYAAELSISEPLPGVNLYEQITAFTNSFTNELISYISIYVLGADSKEKPVYAITDGESASRLSTTAYNNSSPNNMLAAWSKSATSALSYRDDTQSKATGDYYYNSSGANDSNKESLQAQVVFSNQKKQNRDEHYNQLFNSAFQALNKGPIAGGIFGDWSPAADEKLLSRRIFRSECGTENGIPFYNRRVHDRPVDRDISENLRGSEYDFKQYKSDMNDLYYKLQQKNKYKCGKNIWYCN